MNSDTIKGRLVPILTGRLDALASGNPTGGGSLAEQLDQVSLAAHFSSVDRLACAAESIVAASPRLRGLTGAQLRELADRLSDRLSYLEESLVVVEIDPVAPEIQLRSKSPRQDEETRTYFEVQVGQQGIALRRFEKRTGDARRGIAAVLSRDVFCRLCVDLVSAACE